MKRSLLYFVLYRLLDIESILHGILDVVRNGRMKISISLNKINHE